MQGERGKAAANFSLPAIESRATNKHQANSSKGNTLGDRASVQEQQLFIPGPMRWQLCIPGSEVGRAFQSRRQDSPVPRQPSSIGCVGEWFVRQEVLEGKLVGWGGTGQGTQLVGAISFSRHFYHQGYAGNLIVSVPSHHPSPPPPAPPSPRNSEKKRGILRTESWSLVWEQVEGGLPKEDRDIPAVATVERDSP